MKEKFRTHIGTPVEYQRLVLKSGGETICEMADDSRKLGFYSVASGNEIHIVDMDPFSLSRGGGLTDTSLVEKYRMADDAYDKRKGTMRDFIREKRRQDPNFSLKAKSAPGEPKKPAPGPESVESIKIGDRCECMPGARRGVVMFVGEIKEISAGGHWV